MTPASAAARNNADWCDAFCRSHGISGRFTREFWSSPRRSPPRYPDAVTLVPGVAPDLLLAVVEPGDGCSVKDSFADVDLGPAGFRPLFRAEWVLLADIPVRATGWSASPSAAASYPASLLANESIALLTRDGGAAGAVAMRSAGVVGLTNVFASDGDLGAAWLGAAGAAVARWGPLPVVGYETGPALDAVREAGFRSIGELTVWIR